MPRIRTIKPEIWSDEKISRLEPLTRLVFVGLISIADDRGRLVDNLKSLDGQLFPSTDDSCLEALQTLASLGRIERYTSGSEQPLIQITNWHKHQKVDKPSRYSLPAPPGCCDDYSRQPRETVASHPRDSRPPTYDLGPRTNDPRLQNVRGKGIMIFGELRSQRVSSMTGQGGVRYSIPKPILEVLPEAARLALKAIGGPHVLANADDERESVLRGQFAAAYAAAMADTGRFKGVGPLAANGPTPLPGSIGEGLV